jgi:serine/threonine protein kinase
VLSNGNEVAIKRLKPRTAAHSVEVDDFLNEVVFITKMKHRNLVDLKGYCMRGKDQMLVYEYVENMDVEQSLLSKYYAQLVNVL